MKFTKQVVGRSPLSGVGLYTRMGIHFKRLALLLSLGDSFSLWDN
jgi:hypothetical protein